MRLFDWILAGKLKVEVHVDPFPFRPRVLHSSNLPRFTIDSKTMNPVEFDTPRKEMRSLSEQDRDIMSDPLKKLFPEIFLVSLNCNCVLLPS